MVRRMEQEKSKEDNKQNKVNQKIDKYNLTHCVEIFVVSKHHSLQHQVH